MSSRNTVVPKPDFLNHAINTDIITDRARQIHEAVQTAPRLTNVQRRNIQTPLEMEEMKLTPFQLSARGELVLLHAAISEDMGLVKKRDERGFTCLHWACHHGQRCAVELLVYYGADYSLLADQRETPLSVASSNGHSEIVEYLLKAGADINVDDEFGNTPLMFACLCNHVNVVSTLLDWGADLTCENAESLTALDIVQAKEHVQCERIILKKIASLLIEPTF